MALQQMRHIKLWFAGRGGNWPLADYEIDKLKEGFDDVNKLLGGDTVEKAVGGGIASVEKAVEAKDRAAFASAFDNLTAGCNSCHHLLDHAFIVIQRPTALPYSDQIFAPQKYRRPRQRAAAPGLGSGAFRTNISWTLDDVASNRRSTMTYRVYSGPRGSQSISPLEKDRHLFKEFSVLDEAMSWARHINNSGRVALLIEGDDGTRLTKQQIVTALKNPESIDSHHDAA